MANNSKKIDIKKLGIESVSMKTDEATHAKSFAGSIKEQEDALKKFGKARILSMSKAGELIEGLSSDQLLAFKITLDTLERGTDQYNKLATTIDEIEKKLANFKDYDKLIDVYQKYEKTIEGDYKKAEQINKKIDRFITAKQKAPASAASFGTAFHGLTESFDIGGKLKKDYRTYGQSGRFYSINKIVDGLLKSATQNIGSEKYGHLYELDMNKVKSIAIDYMNAMNPDASEKEIEALTEKFAEKARTKYRDPKYAKLYKVDRRGVERMFDAAASSLNSKEFSILSNDFLKKKEIEKYASGKSALRAFLENDTVKKDPKFAGLYSNGEINEQLLSFAERKMEEYMRLKPSGTPMVEQETGLAIRDAKRGGYALLGGIMDRFWKSIEEADKSIIGGTTKGSRIMDIKTGGIYKHYGMQPNLYGLSEAAKTGIMPEELSLLAIPKDPDQSARMHGVKVAPAETIKEAALDAYRIFNDTMSLESRLVDAVELTPEELQIVKQEAYKIYTESESVKEKKYLDEMKIQTSLDRAEVPFVDKSGNPIYQTKKIHHSQQVPLMKRIPIWTRGANGEKIPFLDEQGNQKYTEIPQKDASGRTIMDIAKTKEWDEEIQILDDAGKPIPKMWTDTRLNGKSIYGRSGWNAETLYDAIMNLPEDQRDAFIAQVVFGTADFNEATGNYDERISGYHLGEGVSKGNAGMWDEVRKRIFESGVIQQMSKDWQHSAPSEQFKYGKFAFDQSYHQAMNSPWQELGYGQSISKEQQKEKDMYQKTVEEVEADRLETDEAQQELHKIATDYSMDPEQLGARLMRLVDLADRIDGVFEKIYDSDLFKEHYGDISAEDRQSLTAKFLQANDPEMLEDYQLSRYLKESGSLMPDLADKDYVNNLISILSKANIQGWATPEAENVYKSIEGLAKFDQNWLDKISENFSTEKMGELSPYKERDLIEKLGTGRGLGTRFSNTESPEQRTASGDIVYEAEDISELDEKFVDVLQNIIQKRRLDLYIAGELKKQQDERRKLAEDELKNIEGLEPPPEENESSDRRVKAEQKIAEKAEEIAQTEEAIAEEKKEILTSNQNINNNGGVGSQGGSGILDVHATSLTDYTGNQKVKQIITNDVGKIIAKVMKPVVDIIDWGNGGLSGFIASNKNLSENDFKNLVTSKLTENYDYGYALKSGALNKRGVESLNKIMTQAGFDGYKNKSGVIEQIEEHVEKIDTNISTLVKRKGGGFGGKPKSIPKPGDETGGSKGQSIWDQMGFSKDGWTRTITQFFSLYRVLGKVRQVIQKVITITKELDKAATNIRIVTGKERTEVDDLILSYSKLASQIGSTTTAVAESANTWLRQGYNINEANKLITASTQLSKLGMLDINSATKVLTSTLKGFKMEASEATSIVDKFTKLDTKFAASAGEIGEALSRAASLAQQSGMSLDQASAFVTTIMDITQQSAEMAGTSLRTILARYGNVKAGSFVNADEDDVENINDIEKVLSRIGITIRSSNSDMRAFSDVLDDISEKWLYLTDVEKNAIATAVAGELAPEHIEICA